MKRHYEAVSDLQLINNLLWHHLASFFMDGLMDTTSLIIQQHKKKWLK